MTSLTRYLITLCLLALAVLCLPSCTFIGSERIDPIKNPTARSRQLVVVETAEWDSLTGVLKYYQRDRLGGSWQPMGDTCDVNVGRTGLAWGSGLHGKNLDDGPRKQEGDGKSPAGVFRLSAVFGYAQKESVQYLKMPYIPADSTCQCVYDIHSEYYNLVIDSLSVVKADWKRRERMKQSDNSYKWGVVIDHNSSPREAGGGSCIFLHVWDGPAIATSGCTALEESQIVKLIQWLDAGSNPTLVQLPKAQYQKLKKFWRLH